MQNITLANATDNGFKAVMIQKGKTEMVNGKLTWVKPVFQFIPMDYNEIEQRDSNLGTKVIHANF